MSRVNVRNNKDSLNAYDITVNWKTRKTVIGKIQAQREANLLRKIFLIEKFKL